MFKGVIMAKSAQRAKKVTLANKSLNYAVVQSRSISSMTFDFPRILGSAESILSALCIGST
jgi:hypothetical protein